jgi:hypothetical protein
LLIYRETREKEGGFDEELEELVEDVDREVVRPQSVMEQVDRIVTVVQPYLTVAILVLAIWGSSRGRGGK